MPGTSDAPDHSEVTDDRAITVTSRRWRWLLSFCDLSERDLALLVDAAPLKELSAAVAASFYEHVLRYPELRAVIESATTVERLRDKLQGYYCSIFSGRYDDDRVADVVRIGTTHDRIGVPLMCYLGATLRIDQVVIPALVARYENDLPKLTSALLAYRRLSMCDLAIVTQTFGDARQHTTEGVVAQVGF